ncbi:MAG: FtsX-like permease family protein [Luteitalea sp.]|nr:FtsX-like permease family protein [Luteitalea sp.]
MLVLNDLRYAVRQCRRNPGFAAVSVLTLALGIGANTAIFGIVDAVLFKPLPFRDPHKLVDIALVERRGQAEETFYMGSLTWDQIAAFRAQPQIFSGIEPYGRGREMARTDGDRTDALRVGRLSPGMLALLGLAPQLGRGFTVDDATTAAPLVLVSDGYWRRAFGGDPAALGRTLKIDKHTYTVVGVSPAALRATPFDQTDVWLPMAERIDPQQPLSTGASVIARIRPGLSLEQGERELDLAVTSIQKQNPSRRPWEADLMLLDSNRGDDAAGALLVLLGAVGFVLLIACANVANLMLSRSVVRQREIAIRLSVGATRVRLLRQFLVEGFVLAAAGGSLALLVAWWILDGTPDLVPDRMHLFGRHRPELDLRVLAFAFGAVTLTGLLSSLAPAWRSSGGVMASAAGSGRQATGTTPAQGRARNAFVAVQVGLTLVLLAGAGLMVNSFVRMLAADPGFDIDNLAYVDVGLPQETYSTKTRQDQFFADLLNDVRALAQIRGAAIGTPPPSGGHGRFVLEGGETNVEASPSLTIHHVDAAYFAVAGIEIKRGRSFGRQDPASAPPVAVIDEDAARRFWPGQSALGQRFRYSPYVPWITVVGIAGSVKTQSFTAPRGSVEIYLPLAQEESAPSRTVLFRTSGEQTAAFSAVTSIVRRLDPELAIRRAGVVRDLYDETTKPPRLFASVMSLFAVLGLFTAAVGLYGVLSYSVAQRTQEIGIRIALGAHAKHVRRMIVFDALRPVVVGLLFGIVGALWLTRLLSSQLYGVPPHDPLTFSVSSLLLFVVASAASIAPARRAMRVDPLVALRTD